MPKDSTPGRPGGTPERPARFFADAAEFGAWLAAHHDTETELWMGLAKRHVADRRLTWADAVPEALCWGWIDSVAQRMLRRAGLRTPPLTDAMRALPDPRWRGVHRHGELPGGDQ